MDTRSIIIVFLFALGLTSVGYAEELVHTQELEHNAPQKSALFSPAVFINDGALTECRVVNVSKKPRNIRAQIFRGFDGSEVADTDCGKVSPGTTCSTDYNNMSRGGEDVYCKITVDGPKASVRGVLSIRGTCNGTCQTSVAVDAR
jgi:hypothetical protein